MFALLTVGSKLALEVLAILGTFHLLRSGHPVPSILYLRARHMHTVISSKIRIIILMHTFFMNTHKEKTHVCKANTRMLACYMTWFYLVAISIFFSKVWAHNLGVDEFERSRHFDDQLNDVRRFVKYKWRWLFTEGKTVTWTKIKVTSAAVQLYKFLE